MRNATLECYRSKRLNGKHQVQIAVYSFFDCLEECMRRFRRSCRSVEYSSLRRMCRFSSFDGIGSNETNLINDTNYDFYKFTWCKFYLCQTFIGFVKERMKVDLIELLINLHFIDISFNRLNENLNISFKNLFKFM